MECNLNTDLWFPVKKTSNRYYNHNTVFTSLLDYFINFLKKMANSEVDSLLVGKLFINIADIYCFGTGLPISKSKHVFQYRHFK